MFYKPHLNLSLEAFFVILTCPSSSEQIIVKIVEDVCRLDLSDGHIQLLMGLTRCATSQIFHGQCNVKGS